MLPLSTVCETFISSQYRYTVCPYQYVNQIQVNGGNYRGCIGYGCCEETSCSIWKEYSEPPISNSEIRLHMTDGENCFTGTDRETELVISCDDSLDKMLSVSAVNEVQTCHYVIEASSPLVCKIPEATISVSVGTDDEVGVRSEVSGEQGQVAVEESVKIPGGDVTTPEGDVATSEGNPSTPKDNTSAPDDSTATPDRESSTSQKPTPDNPTTPESQPATTTLSNRSHHEEHQP